MTLLYIHMGMTGDRRVNVMSCTRVEARRELARRVDADGMFRLAMVKAIRSAATGRFLAFDRVAGRGRVK